MKKVSILTGILLTTPLFLLAPAQKPNSSRSGIDFPRLAKLREQLESFVNQGTIAGAVTLIAHRGEVVSLEAIGYQDLESKKPMRADSIFDIRSVTKPVTAIGIMILMEEG